MQGVDATGAATPVGVRQFLQQLHQPMRAPAGRASSSARPRRDHTRTTDEWRSAFDQISSLCVRDGAVPVDSLRRGAAERLRAYDFPSRLRSREDELEHPGCGGGGRVDERESGRRTSTRSAKEPKIVQRPQRIVRRTVEVDRAGRARPRLASAVALEKEIDQLQTVSDRLRRACVQWGAQASSGGDGLVCEEDVLAGPTPTTSGAGGGRPQPRLLRRGAAAASSWKQKQHAKAKDNLSKDHSSKANGCAPTSVDTMKASKPALKDAFLKKFVDVLFDEDYEAEVRKNRATSARPSMAKVAASSGSSSTRRAGPNRDSACKHSSHDQDALRDSSSCFKKKYRPPLRTTTTRRAPARPAGEDEDARRVTFTAPVLRLLSQVFQQDDASAASARRPTSARRHRDDWRSSLRSKELNIRESVASSSKSNVLRELQEARQYCLAAAEKEKRARDQETRQDYFPPPRWSYPVSCRSKSEKTVKEGGTTTRGPDHLTKRPYVGIDRQKQEGTQDRTQGASEKRTGVSQSPRSVIGAQKPVSPLEGAPRVGSSSSSTSTPAWAARRVAATGGGGPEYFGIATPSAEELASSIVEVEKIEDMEVTKKKQAMLTSLPAPSPADENLPSTAEDDIFTEVAGLHGGAAPSGRVGEGAASWSSSPASTCLSAAASPAPAEPESGSVCSELAACPFDLSPRRIRDQIRTHQKTHASGSSSSPAPATASRSSSPAPPPRARNRRTVAPIRVDRRSLETRDLRFVGQELGFVLRNYEGRHRASFVGGGTGATSSDDDLLLSPVQMIRIPQPTPSPADRPRQKRRSRIGATRKEPRRSFEEVARGQVGFRDGSSSTRWSATEPIPSLVPFSTTSSVSARSRSTTDVVEVEKEEQDDELLFLSPILCEADFDVGGHRGAGSAADEGDDVVLNRLIEKENPATTRSSERKEAEAEAKSPAGATLRALHLQQQRGGTRAGEEVGEEHKKLFSRIMRREPVHVQAQVAAGGGAMKGSSGDLRDEITSIGSYKCSSFEEVARGGGGAGSCGARAGTITSSRAKPKGKASTTSTSARISSRIRRSLEDPLRKAAAPHNCYVPRPRTTQGGAGGQPQQARAQAPPTTSASSRGGRAAAGAVPASKNKSRYVNLRTSASSNTASTATAAARRNAYFGQLQQTWRQNLARANRYQEEAAGLGSSSTWVSPRRLERYRTAVAAPQRRFE